MVINKNNFLDRHKIIVVGGGLVGSLGATMLAQRGAKVLLVERQSEETIRAFSNRRSFNITISSRGKAALEAAGLWKRIEARTIPITGRMCHMGGLESSFPYSPDCELALHGARRSDINTELLDAAIDAGVEIRFGWMVTDLDKATGAVSIGRVSGEGDIETIDDATFVIGADGINSAVRRMIHRDERTNFTQAFLDWSYREVTIPARNDAGNPWVMDPHSLHIWPRGDLMMFALPNPDGSFTGNFIYPTAREADFTRPGMILDLFKTEFPDVIGHVPDIEDKLRSTSPSYFQTQRNSKWYSGDRFVLVGDAAHATVPFYGQGMNSGFESMVELLSCLERFGMNDRARAFATYQQTRKPHTDAVADLSIANFDELRSNFQHLLPQARRRIDVLLYRLMPSTYVPLHIKISHSNIGYRTAIEQCARRDRILGYFGFNLLIYAFAAGQLAMNWSMMSLAKAHELAHRLQARWQASHDKIGLGPGAHSER